MFITVKIAFIFTGNTVHRSSLFTSSSRCSFPFHPYGLEWAWLHLEHLLTLWLSDQICNSPYCQPHNSYNVSSEILVLDQLIIPKLIYFFIIITYLVDIVRRNCKKTNRFQVAVRLFSNRSHMTSKCGKNIRVAHEVQPTWNLFVKLITA